MGSRLLELLANICLTWKNLPGPNTFYSQYSAIKPHFMAMPNGLLANISLARKKLFRAKHFIHNIHQ
jgi:hypothetical protein